MQLVRVAALLALVSSAYSFTGHVAPGLTLQSGSRANGLSAASLNRPLPTTAPVLRLGSAASTAAKARARPVVAAASGKQTQYPLESQRWTQLVILSLLALLSDWVCFSTAAVPGEWMLMEGHEASQLIDIFLFSNVVSCFFYTDLCAAFGLRRVIVGAAWLMLGGCFLRSGVPNPLESADSLVKSMPSYTFEVLGTIFVGAAQPFFQCAPPLLSATWFAPSERALATATAINFNQVGIATAFIVGGLMANTPAGMHSYFDLITIFALFAAFVTTGFFYERPEMPPSASAAAERREEEEREAEMRKQGREPGTFDLTALTYPTKAKELLGKEGFVFATAAFVASIGCTNVISAFTAPELARAGLQEGFGIDLAGAGFQFAIVLGGIGLGRYVDVTKNYKTTMLACFAVAVSTLTALGVSEGYDQTFAAPAVLVLLFMLGASAGPVQPIAAELAVETSYPCDENAVESTQQLAGNLFSALLVPICEMASEGDLQFPGKVIDLRGDTIVLMALLVTVALYFSRFNSPLVRTQLDNAE